MAGAARQILLVEDHADTRFILEKLLKKWGYDVVAVGTVNGALEKVDQTRFHLLLSDVGLPDASGIDLMKAIRARSSLPGIAMSGFDSPEDIFKARAAGFKSYLKKPFGKQALKLVIQKFI